MNERLITSMDDIQEGVYYLIDLEPQFKTIHECCGLPPLRRKDQGFARLFGAIVSQQVSVAAADAIWGRIVDAGFDNPENIKNSTDEDLRAVGLSRQKIKYAKALANAAIDYVALNDLPTSQVTQVLTKVSGIGQWTAEIYAMFSLGRADVFAPGDIALQEAARVLYKLKSRPTERELRTLSQRWSPWRAVAARMFWAYYAYDKKREGIQ